MKKFTKILLFVLSFALIVSLAACEFGKTPTTPTYEAGITSDILTIEAKVGDKLDLLQGIKAIDAKGNSVLSSVQASTNAPLDEEGCLKQSGTYLVRYVVEIEGEKYSFQRTLNVIFELPETEELVVNGDFELGALDPFTKSEFDNGSATLSVVKNGENHELEVIVNSRSWQEASPRVETNVFALTDGQNYKVSFKARAVDPRTIYVQIGQLLAAAPWFNQLGNAYFALTEEMQEFSFIFKADASADLTQIQLLFGFGTVSKGTSCETTCYLDDIKVEETEEEIPNVDPEPVEYADPNNLLGLTGLVKNGDENGARAEAGTVYVWYVQSPEWQCGPAVQASFQMTEAGIEINSKLTAEHWWFATQVFLYSKPIKDAGHHLVTFTLNANNAGTIQINGQKVDLVVGENQIEVPFDNAAGAQFGLSMQLGWEEAGDGENISHTYVGDHHLVLSNLAIDGKPVEQFGEQQSEDGIDLLVEGWYDLDGGDTYAFELNDGVLKLSKNPLEGKEWSVLVIKLEDVDLTKVAEIALKVKGAAGKQMLVKYNDTQEFWVNTTGELQELSFEIPAGFAYNAEKFTMVLFTEPGAQGTNAEFEISELKLIEAKEEEAPQVVEGDVDLLVDGWYDNENGSAYTFTFENGVLSFAKHGGGEWSVMGIKVAGADLSGYYAVKGQVKGPEGEQMIVKLNDNGAAEKWITCTGELQDFEIILPAGFTFNPNTHTMVLFANPGAAGTSNTFEVHELKVIEKAEEEPQVVEGDVDLLVDGWYDNEGGSAYKFAFENGVLSFAKFGGGEWSVMAIDLTDANFTGYYAVKGQVKGPEGEQMIVKLNDNGAAEQWITCTGELQDFEIIIPADFQFDASKHTMVLFANPGAAGTGNIFEVHELKVIETAEEQAEQGEAGEFALYLDGTGNNRNHIEGAGAWIWIQNSSIGMTGDAFGAATVTAQCELGVVEAFFSDLTTDYVRVYVVMPVAPAADQELAISLHLEVAGKEYAGTVTFLGTELK